MNLYNEMLKKYGYNKPIFFKELITENYSLITIKKNLEQLVSNGKIIRFEKGIYYIPIETELGPSLLDPSLVINKKYIVNNNGYFTGLYLMNKLGLTTQMTNKIEIYSNNESTKCRKIVYNGQFFIMRKSRTKINKNNIDTLSFLDLMNYIDLKAIDKDQIKIIYNYYSNKNINSRLISKYSKFYPEKVLRNLIESGLIFDFASK